MKPSLGMCVAPNHPWFGAPEPAVISLAFPDRPTDAEVKGAFEALSLWMRRDVTKPYSFIIFVDRVLSMSAVQRKHVAEAEAGYEQIERRFNAGQAMVAEGPVQRGLITAFTWMSPPVWPYKIVSDESAGLSWLRDQWNRVTVDYPDGPLWRGRLRR